MALTKFLWRRRRHRVVNFGGGDVDGRHRRPRQRERRIGDVTRHFHRLVTGAEGDHRLAGARHDWFRFYRARQVAVSVPPFFAMPAATVWATPSTPRTGSCR